MTWVWNSPSSVLSQKGSKEGKEGGRERRRKKGRKENSYNTLSSIFDSFKKKLKLWVTCTHLPTRTFHIKPQLPMSVLESKAGFEWQEWNILGPSESRLVWFPHGHCCWVPTGSPTLGKVGQDKRKFTGDGQGMGKWPKLLNIILLSFFARHSEFEHKPASTQKPKSPVWSGKFSLQECQSLVGSCRHMAPWQHTIG